MLAHKRSIQIPKCRELGRHDEDAYEITTDDNMWFTLCQILRFNNDKKLLTNWKMIVWHY